MKSKINLSKEALTLLQENQDTFEKLLARLAKLNLVKIRFDTYEFEHYDDSLEYSLQKTNGEEREPIYGHMTPTEAEAGNLIVAGAMLTLQMQHAWNKFWPDEDGNEPKFIEFGFGINDQAFLELCGDEGTVLFKAEEYFKETEKISGTWEEILTILEEINSEIKKTLRDSLEKSKKGFIELLTEKRISNSTVGIRYYEDKGIRIVVFLKNKSDFLKTPDEFNGFGIEKETGRLIAIAQ